MKRSNQNSPLAVTCLLLASVLCSASAATDLVIYGATPCGIAAAFAAAREGRSSVLLHPLSLIGGMMTGGLGQTDVGDKSVIGGLAHDVFLKIGAKYNSSGPVYVFEPHVALSVFNDMLAEAGIVDKVTLVTSVTIASVQKAGARVTSITVAPSAAAVEASAASPSAWAELVAPVATTYEGSVFLDASYEGDLIALAGISTAFGREGNSTYGEYLAGRLAVPNAFGGHQFSVPLDYKDASGNLLPLITNTDPGPEGEGDNKVQAFNFRLCLTDVAANQRPLEKPADYDAATWELLRRYIAAKWPSGNFSLGSLMNISPLPNHKTDINNNGAISTDVIGASWGWPEGTPAQRAALFDAHVSYTRGFLWFLATDAAVPPAVRADMQRWGLAADEYGGEWTPQLYVREGRRMVSDFVFRQQDRETNLTKPDSIGLFSYNIDTHNSQRFPQGDFVRNEGDIEVFGSKGPGQMPYSMIVPRRGEATNVLAPVPCSASHLGYGTIRLEPQFLIIGESAGIAAAQFVAAGGAVQDLDIAALQARLRAVGQLIDLPKW